MTPPRHINGHEQIQLGTITTILLADGLITPEKLNLSVFGSGVVPNGTTGAIDINVDDVSLEIDSFNVLKVKSISTAQITIDADLDFHNYEALNFRLENVTSDPSPGNVGRIVWRADLSEIRVDNGTAFVPILGHTIENDGTALPSRAVLNFIGPGVTVTDTGTKTQVEIVGETSTYAKDFFTVINITDKTLLLAETPLVNSEVVAWNGLLLRLGALNDYTITGNTVTLNAGVTLTVGDELLVVYAY